MIIIWEVTFEIWKHYCIFIAFLVSTWGTCSLASVVLPLSNLKCDGIHPFCLSLGRGVQVGTDGNAHDQIYHATQKITYNISYEVFPNETFCWIYHSITFIFLMASYDLPVLDEMPCRLASRWQFGHVGISSHEISFGLAWRKWKNVHVVHSLEAMKNCPCCLFWKHQILNSEVLNLWPYICLPIPLQCPPSPTIFCSRHGSVVLRSDHASAQRQQMGSKVGPAAWWDQYTLHVWMVSHAWGFQFQLGYNHKTLT